MPGGSPRTRPATAHHHRAPQIHSPSSAGGRPGTAHQKQKSSPHHKAGVSHNEANGSLSAESLRGQGWNWHVQNSEVARLKERIAQLELKILRTSTGEGEREGEQLGGGGGGERSSSEYSSAELLLLEALMWAPSEHSVFAGISMSQQPDSAAFTSLLQWMLHNAGHVGMPQEKVAALADELFKKHSNPFTRKLDLNKLRALVQRQHVLCEHKRVRDWVRSEVGYTEEVTKRLSKACIKTGLNLRCADPDTLAGSLDGLGNQIRKTLTANLAAYQSWQKAENARFQKAEAARSRKQLAVAPAEAAAVEAGAEAVLKFGVAATALVPLSDCVGVFSWAQGRGLEEKVCSSRYFTTSLRYSATSLRYSTTRYAR